MRQGVIKDKDRRPLHHIVDHRHFGAAGKVDDLHAAVVAGHQRAFRRRHRYNHVAIHMLAVNGHRPGKADRHLGDAREVRLMLP